MLMRIYEWTMDPIAIMVAENGAILQAVPNTAEYDIPQKTFAEFLDYVINTDIDWENAEDFELRQELDVPISEEWVNALDARKGIVTPDGKLHRLEQP